ncbi:MAG: asparagine synthase (glutamine-hydrolyzing) [Sphingomonas sp.]|uniref:asparagine synthase (glutamine-hydrolyzing) n=1 Tax=Sphingomonas sp. TaxID=28214 RepID=UPI0017B0DF14|nr:asparagine synthase (glutamine-hydrolyzing) [Sphingomonas sp.]MBA3666273.1 asparagine synthase (glutamine-hydrolyzing) [Sphingomonas sp.]
MCGIAGLLGPDAAKPDVVRRMTAVIAHRGPDDHDVWTDPEAGIALGHRRLAILDLSPHGHQPMHSADGRFVVSYNGELYNHTDIRHELEQCGKTPEGGWRGHSDTETLVEAIAAWGLERAIDKAVGMFAFALWDRKDRMLRLVRDRFGEKPLYYGQIGKDLAFASELKSLREHPRFNAEIDRDALKLYAARTYVPAPYSIYRGIYKLQPGCILSIPAGEPLGMLNAPPEEGAAGPIRLTRYWSYRGVMAAGLTDPIHSERGALEALDKVLGTAIRRQAIADVPVGAFLSGGIDSSTIVALYQKYSSTPVRTYSIGFTEAGFDEAQHAKAVAAHLGTVHHEHYVSVAEARDVIPLLPAIYDEPFADSSQIPTFLVSKFARCEVTVALTGDGGDELFAGYNRHIMAPRLWQRLQKMPRAARALAAGPLGLVPPAVWGRLASMVGGGGSPFLGGKIQKGIRVAGGARRFDDVYLSFLDEWSQERSPVLGAGPGSAGFDLDPPREADDTHRMMYGDAVSYLPDDILCKVDRASMAVSLETRVPFLDHRVAALAARIPLNLKVRNGTGKHILRELLFREAPRALFDRPKAGFAVPVGEWIKGPLRSWAEDLLDSRRMTAEGWFDASIVQRRWRDHLAGRRDSTPALWAVLMFQAWLREQKEMRALAA